MTRPRPLVYISLVMCIAALCIQGWAGPGCGSCTGASFGAPPPGSSGTINYNVFYVNTSPGETCCAADYSGQVLLPDGTVVDLPAATVPGGSTHGPMLIPYQISTDPVQTAWATISTPTGTVTLSYPYTIGPSLPLLFTTIEHWGEEYSTSDVDGVSPVDVQDLIGVLLAWQDD